jgi:hypothetical protein
MPLCRNSNDTYTKSVKPTRNYLKNEPTASRASTSVASLLGLLVASLAEIIRSGVDNNCTL